MLQKLVGLSVLYRSSHCHTDNIPCLILPSDRTFDWAS